MNVFDFRNRLIADYRGYVSSFVRVADPRLKQVVEGVFADGSLWPDPLIQLNPSYAPGRYIDELVKEGVLQPGCEAVFRRGKTDVIGSGVPLRLHQHQEDAIRIAKERRNYVLTTGTGSGKSLSYIVPIVDRVIEQGTGKGIRAIVVFPMNALANSQFGELEKFLSKGFPDGKGPVTFQRYTGQEDDNKRQQIIATPPDILLTNYVMLELILTRPGEDKLIRAAKNLEFIVLDELHTYRGRQGADVAMLLRRLRQLLGGQYPVQFVGTSATLAGPGTWEEQRAEVARLATRLFGSQVAPADIIGETLRLATGEIDLAAANTKAALRAATTAAANGSLPETYEQLAGNVLARWVETTFGIRRSSGDNRLVRSKPISLTGESGAAAVLAKETELSPEICGTAITAILMAGAIRIKHPETGFPVFAFRLHQFISRGDTIYATLEKSESRYLTIRGQQFSPDDAAKLLLPLCFCRECGHEFYSVWERRDEKTGAVQFLAREAHDRAEVAGQVPGLLYVSEEKPWPADQDPAVLDRLPVDWLEESRGRRVVKDSYRRRLPRHVCVQPGGTLGSDGLDGAFIPTPLVFCPACGVTHNTRQRSDFPKLGTLGSEGRSTATTILATSTVAQLRREESIPDTARKLLSFTDNRQDASLQSGHLNDFLEVGLLRGALYRAASEAGMTGLRDDTISQKVMDALALPLGEYAADPTVKFAAREAVIRTLRDVVGYRVYRDLRRGWRVNAPNLEQCGLLEVDYESLNELANDESTWNGENEVTKLPFHGHLVAASPEERAEICRTLLDFVRRDLAIDVKYLTEPFHEQLKLGCSNHLRDPWKIDDTEALEVAKPAYPCSEGEGDKRPALWVSPKGGFGQFLRSARTFPEQPALNLAETAKIILDLFEALRTAGIVKRINTEAGVPVPGYLINPGALIWRAGDGTKAYHDRIRMPTETEEGSRPNPFFVDHYRNRVHGLRGICSREHTAQVASELRQQRETDFREARLPILFCSPTMELGIDISDLNAVNMRNVPPTPANYAQRSGRAGRSGQPALVYTYCSFGSPHDQYFFRHPELMVAGQVQTPRIDITNEDLLRAHVHAIWLRETGIDLQKTPADLVEISGEEPSLELKPEVRIAVENPAARTRARDRAANILAGFAAELEKTGWHDPDWLDTAINGVVQSFEQAFSRWRSMYRAALKQAQQQDKIIRDQAAAPDARNQAERLRKEAEAQLKLLADRQNSFQSDFYSYRYFASEGFLPGYNFPRLPLSAFIPGRRGLRDEEEFVSRPRFLAISEFGPGALIYHEGSRYQVTRVTLPVGGQNDTGVQLTTAKLCSKCGYLHPVGSGPGPDNCERCNEPLGLAIGNLFRMQNVVTRRRQRISCDEEERLRLGYEIRTGVRFADRAGRPLFRSAEVFSGEKPLLSVVYGDAVRIWRINCGWSRRQNQDELGFMLDVERRQWTKNSIEPDDEDENGGASRSRLRVVPFVDDWRNALRLTLAGEPTPAFVATIEAALRRAIQLEYQLEDSELASEPLPNRSKRNHILFYEAAEGGAGVLRQIANDAQALPRIARRALEHLHFDPVTGADLGKAPTATERCQAACYDCLLSYYNQPDHPLLDRRLVKDFLLELANARVEPSPAEAPRSEHLQQLKDLCDSGLEKDFLGFLEAHDLALPTHGQRLLASFGTRPDFLYDGANPAVVYIDGPPHDFPERQQRDRNLTTSLEDAGYLVIRFHHRDDWLAKVKQHPSIFGSPRQSFARTELAVITVRFNKSDPFSDSEKAVCREEATRALQNVLSSSLRENASAFEITFAEDGVSSYWLDFVVSTSVLFSIAGGIQPTGILLGKALVAAGDLTALVSAQLSLTGIWLQRAVCRLTSPTPESGSEVSRPECFGVKQDRDLRTRRCRGCGMQEPCATLIEEGAAK